uniref:TMF_TATA_bd domain-containing protein n=1 Tax=Anopheles epiroticus TaxID=199890 RepID=A0A182PWY6_9DIPT
MSWFDTAGIANLAKNALKEAQKHIDKALDIKDEEEAMNLKRKSACSGKINDEMLGNKSLHSVFSSHHTHGGKSAMQFNNFAVAASVGKGTFTDQTIVKIDEVIKTPSNLRYRSTEGSENGNFVTCGELTNSESIEILSLVTDLGSAKSSPPRSLSYEIAVHNLELSESVGPIAPSQFSTLESSATIDHSAHLGILHGPQSTVLKKHTDSGVDNNLHEDDHFSNTLLVQPITLLQSSESSHPITVAPCRSSNVFSSPSNLSSNVVRGSSVHRRLKDQCEKTPLQNEHSSKTAYNNLNFAMDNSLKQIAKECSSNHAIDSSQDRIFLQPKQTLESTNEIQDSSSENLDFSQSVEHVKSGGNTITHLFSTTVSNIQLENIDFFSDAASESPVGLVSSQCLLQSLGDDEIDTTTSSDIEIISSPNGCDSSSTNSGVYRSSPLKISIGTSENFEMLLIKKHQGHTREPSEISINSGNSDDLCIFSEKERLMRRLVEISETLEQRENRLVELGRQNAELHEKNAQLTAQLELKAKREGGPDLEGYMQRLSALERKFQQSIREKENLKCKLDTLRLEADKRVAKYDMDQVLIERDFMINELKQEGEGLSKQVLHHTNVIKKLRAKEKESDVIIRQQCDEIKKLTLETERLNRTLSAKEEVERSQIDAVHKLTSDKCILERERAILIDKLDGQIQKYETLRNSFEFARNELKEKSELCKDLQTRFINLQSTETDLQSYKKTNDILIKQMDDLREQLRKTEQDYGQRLIRMKNEHAEAVRKLETSEFRTEEEKNTTALLTIPLMKQLESLQNTFRHKERHWEQREASFVQQLSQTSKRLRLIAEHEKTQRAVIIAMQNRLAYVEKRLTDAYIQTEEIVKKIKQHNHDVEIAEGEFIHQYSTVETANSTTSQCIQKINNELQSDINNVSLPAYEGCTEKNKSIKQNIIEEGEECKTIVDSPMSKIGLNEHLADTSTATSIANLSLPDSFNNNTCITPDDDSVGKEENSFDGILNEVDNVSILYNTTSLLETLQASLKQRDGEVNQLQWEVSRFHQERNVLSTEISNLTMELENVRERFQCSIRLEKEHMELQNRYDALLQLYGESVEKTEELQLDLADVKEMYKLQIDDLLQRQRDLISTKNCRSS